MSVWLGWHVIHAITRFAPFADSPRAWAGRTLARPCRRASRAAIESVSVGRRVVSPGDLRRRHLARRDKTSDECKIDSIAQTWAVISRAGDPGHVRCRQWPRCAAISSTAEERLVKLFTPPFDRTRRMTRVISAATRPDCAKNGGQYSHAAMWTIVASAMMGDGRRCGRRCFDLLNPINHALTERRRRFTIGSNPMSSPPTSIRLPPKRRPRRLDMVHRRCGLDVPGGHRAHPWTAPHGRNHAPEAVPAA